MWKRSAVALSVCACVAILLGLSASALAQAPAQAPAAPQRRSPLPPGPMEEKAATACLGCHTAQIIVQQQLDKKIWTKEMDKMIRWGAPVAPEDREAMIDYFAQHFGPREKSEVEPVLPDGAGVEKVRGPCLACHDAGNIMEEPRDRRGWTRILNKMEGWGAVIHDADRAAILDYLVAHFGPPAAKNDRKEEKQK